MYIDPGSGSLVVQILAAGVLAFVATVRGAREALTRGVRRLLGRRADGS
jgi:hypothetical protein